MLDAYAGFTGRLKEYAGVYSELREVERELEKHRVDEAEKSGCATC